MNPFEGYRISSPYGYRNDPLGVRGTEFHTGIDLVKSHQAPIHAFAAGEVLHAKLGVTGSGFGNFGNVVAVRDKNGYLHCYCHLDSCLVKQGQRVERGQAVGRQGNTGKVAPAPTPANPAAGSHLHYEVRAQSSPSFGYGTHVDPTAYLTQLLQSANQPNDPTPEKEGDNMTEKLTSFPDVDAGRWSEKVIKVVSDLGIMKGYPDGTFKPGQPATREELAKVINDLLYLINQKKG